MKSRIVAIILTVVLTVTLAACGKNNGTDTTDTVKELPKFGFREYQCDFITGDRVLSAKYENLGTERTLTGYDEEWGVKYIEKWYYDDTGEHLLKHVSWSIYDATRAQEYDMKGRIIRRSEKLEDPAGRPDHWEAIYFPEEYESYSKKENKNVGLANYMYGGYVGVKPDVREIVTEYTYFGETDTIKGIKSVSDSGDVIGLLERGDGDIILRALIDGEYVHYEETYDAAAKTGEFDYILSEGEEVYTAIHGTRQYNASGYYTQITTQNDIGADEGKTIEVSYEYDADGGYKESQVTRPYPGVEPEYYTAWYDSDGKCLRGEATTEYKRYSSKFEYSYYENGNPSKYLSEYYDPTGGSSNKVEKEYYEDGELRSNKFYDNGKLMEENTYTYMEMPGVAGQVLCRKEFKEEYSGETHNTAYYSIRMPDGYEPSKTKEVVFSTSYLDEYGETWYSQRGEFDSEGRLIRIEETYGSDVTKAKEYGLLKVTEFDERGRMVKDYTRCWPNTEWNSRDVMEENGTVREYWDGEDPLAGMEDALMTVTEMPKEEQ